MKEKSIDEIRADPELMRVVDATAPALFGDNCAACHGPQAAGGPGFPSLVDSAWLWGGGSDDIMETLRVGINSPHPETRISQMPAFGYEGILTRDEIRAVDGLCALAERHRRAAGSARGGAILSPTIARAATATAAKAQRISVLPTSPMPSGSMAATRPASLGRSTAAGTVGCLHGRGVSGWRSAKF